MLLLQAQVPTWLKIPPITMCPSGSTVTTNRDCRRPGRFRQNRDQAAVHAQSRGRERGWPADLRGGSAPANQLAVCLHGQC